MLLTTLAILFGTALAAEAGIATHGALRRELWEPSLAVSLARRDTGWKLVETVEVYRSEITRGQHDHMRDDTFDEEVAKIAKKRGIDYDHYSIDWRFGCVDPESGEKLGPGWFRPRYSSDYFHVFFYKEPPKPKPAPKPKPTFDLQVAPIDTDEKIATIIDFMRHPSAFWLAPDFSGGSNLRDGMTPFWSRDPVVPVLRYTRNKTWLAEDHKGLERYADLHWDANRKMKFKVVYDDEHHKPTYHYDFREAVEAIGRHFERCFGAAPVEFIGMVRWQIGIEVNRPELHARLQSDEYAKLLRRLSQTGLTISEFEDACRWLNPSRGVVPSHFAEQSVSMIEGPHGVAEFTAQERNRLLQAANFSVAK